MITWKRTLKTKSSERFLALKNGEDIAAFDLHYLENGTVAGTVVILKNAGIQESEVPNLLSSFDEDFLPGVDLQEGTLTYTVVFGEILGNFEASSKEA